MQKTLLKTMIETMNQANAAFISAKIGEYTIIVTNSENGAKHLLNAWDGYVNKGCKKNNDNL